MTARILIVDDEPPIVNLLAYNLKQAHYEVFVARDGEEAVRQARREQPDLIILDVMLPKLDGFDVCRALRRENDVPIIMLTAREDEIDRVVGLELGADDYVVKPFSVRELMARVKNVLRRSQPQTSSPPANVIHLDALSIDLTRGEATWQNSRLPLTSLELRLLHALAQHAGQILSREQLLEQVWGYDYYGDLRVVDAAIKRLRARLREVNDATDFITTARGMGYKLDLV